jgi:hypothetical protein
MSKQKILFDWTEPPAGKDEGEAVQKVAAEIARVSIPGYTPPASSEAREDMPKSARRREKEREAEHQERIEALEREEKRLRDERRRMAKLAEEEEAEQRQQKQKQRDQEVQQRERQQRDASERRRLAALEHEWGNFKIHAARAQHEQRREAYFQDLQRTVDDLGRMINPPPAPEREIIYVEKDDEPGAGALPTLPRWR